MSFLPLGAINKKNGAYVYPKIANKFDCYICPECNKDLVFCKGELRREYFRHKNVINENCTRFNKPSESDIHKDAKFLLKTLLENKTNISFLTKCYKCSKEEDYKIIYINTVNIETEYCMEYDERKIIPDVALLENNRVKYIFEIFHTHKTKNDNRPDPWFEINASNLLITANELNNSIMNFVCIRRRECMNCKNKLDKQNIINIVKKHILEKYIRIMLGLKKAPNPYKKKVLSGEFYFERDFDKLDIHKRFEFDANENYYDNKKIAEKFFNGCGDYRFIIYSHKGTLLATIIDKNLYYNKDEKNNYILDKNYNCWDDEDLFNEFDDNNYIYKFGKKFTRILYNFTGYRTRDIIYNVLIKISELNQLGSK